MTNDWHELTDLTADRRFLVTKVRLDSGVESGDVIGGAFDSMLAKLIITGKDRTQALARARRALAEFVIEGMPTVLAARPQVFAATPHASISLVLSN